VVPIASGNETLDSLTLALMVSTESMVTLLADKCLLAIGGVATAEDCAGGACSFRKANREALEVINVPNPLDQELTLVPACPAADDIGVVISFTDSGIEAGVVSGVLVVALEADSISLTSALLISMGGLVELPVSDVKEAVLGRRVAFQRPLTPSTALKKLVEPVLIACVRASRVGASCCSNLSS